MRSADILKRPDFCFNRAVYKSMGFSDEDLGKPIIGIANCWSEVVPGNYNLRELAKHVKYGIYAAGGTPVEFGVTGVCDGTAQGNRGMNFCLPSRDLLAYDVEIMAEAHQLDGLVLLGSCDKNVPGLLLAAVRLNLPTIILPGGPMQGGIEFDGRKSDLTSLSEGCGMLSAGTLDEDSLYELENKVAPGCGSCSFYGTANTLCCMAEALGMVLPGAALIPAVYAERSRSAFSTGQAIMHLVKENILPRDIITEKAIDNAIRILNATGGSTNGVLHMLALGREIGIDSKTMMSKFDSIGKETPLIVKINPAAKYNVEDLYHDGGIPVVMKELEELLTGGCMTVTGKTVKENLQNVKHAPADSKVIRTVADPFSRSGGIAIVRGNLAPETGITKPSAIDPRMHVFSGTARVFNSEEEAEHAILSNQIEAGNVVVIRYEGPKGGPGMREMFKAMKYLVGAGLSLSTAIVTDGRFSGTNNGCFVGHISPEAAEGGPIALVEDGDQITIDIPNQSLHLHVDDETLNERKKKWVRPEAKYRKGYLGLYEKFATSASEGGVIDYE